MVHFSISQAFSFNCGVSSSLASAKIYFTTLTPSFQRKSCQRCRFDKCLEVGMKSSWVLSEEERFRRFRKHREKVQQQQLVQQHQDINGSSPPNHGYYDDQNSGDEADDRIPNPYSPDSDRKYGYGRGSPSYLSPPPLSPLNHHQMDNKQMVAAAVAPQVRPLTLLF